MTIRTDYYVYAYLRKSDGTPYYIGKGTGYRINKKDGHPFLPVSERRVKLAENLTEQAALDLEVELIAKYGRKKYDEGGILYNTTLGGEGASIHRTEESRQASIRAYKESDRYQELQKKNRKIRQERLRADTEDGRMRRKKKSESDKRYREDPRYRDKILQRKKEYYEENREEFCRKNREYRATPEGKKKKADSDHNYWESIKSDSEKYEKMKKYKAEWATKKRRKRGVPTKYEMAPPFKVVSPEGVVYEGQGYRKFAREHGLHACSFANMVKGKFKQHKGWKRVEETEQNSSVDLMQFFE